MTKPLIDYDCSSDDGPTIVIDLHSRSELLLLRDLILELACGEGKEIALERAIGAKISGLDPCTLWLDPAAGDSDNARTRRVFADGTRLICRWGESPEGWTWIAEIIDALVQHDSPGCQYLNRAKGGVDDALVEVAYRQSCRR